MREKEGVLMHQRDIMAELKELARVIDVVQPYIPGLIEAEMFVRGRFGEGSPNYVEHSERMQIVMESIYQMLERSLSPFKPNTARRLATLNLERKFLNPLLKAGIETVDDVLASGPEKLLAIQNFGPRGLKILEEELIYAGYHVPWIDE